MKDIAKERYEVILTYNDILREKQSKKKPPVFPEPDSLEKEMGNSRISHAAVPTALDHLHNRMWRSKLRKNSTDEPSGYQNQIVKYDPDNRAVALVSPKNDKALIPQVVDSEIGYHLQHEPSINHAQLVKYDSDSEEDEGGALEGKLALKGATSKNSQYHYLMSHRFALSRRKSRRILETRTQQQIMKDKIVVKKLSDMIQLKNEKGEQFSIEATPENMVILGLTQTLDIDRLAAWQNTKLVEKIEENKIKRRKKQKEKERALRLKQILEEDEMGIYGDKEDIERLKIELAENSDSEDDEEVNKAAIRRKVEEKQKLSKTNTAAPSMVQLLKMPDSSQSSLKGTKPEVSRQIIAMLNKRPGKIYEENFGIPVDIKDIHPSAYIGTTVINKTGSHDGSELNGTFKDHVLERTPSHSKDGDWSRRDSFQSGQARYRELSKSGMSRRTQMWSARGGDTMRSNPNESMALNELREQEAQHARKIYEVKQGLRTDYVHNSHLVKTAEERAINPKYYENLCDYPELEHEKEKSGKYIADTGKDRRAASGAAKRSGVSKEQGRLGFLANRPLRNMRYQVGSTNERNYNSFLVQRQSPQLEDEQFRDILRLVQRDIGRR